jgi:DNA-directed RNA polymerase beta subunit
MENFPITDTRNNFVLEFLDYFVDPPRYNSRMYERGLLHSVPLKARLNYIVQIQSTKILKLLFKMYILTIPYMTPSGTFVINGAERVVVSQLHRSPGFSLDSLFNGLWKCIFCQSNSFKIWQKFQRLISVYTLICRKKRYLYFSALKKRQGLLEIIGRKFRLEKHAEDRRLLVFSSIKKI